MVRWYKVQLFFHRNWDTAYPRTGLTYLFLFVYGEIAVYWGGSLEYFKSSSDQSQEMRQCKNMCRFEVPRNASGVGIQVYLWAKMETTRTALEVKIFDDLVAVTFIQADSFSFHWIREYGRLIALIAAKQRFRMTCVQQCDSRERLQVSPVCVPFVLIPLPLLQRRMFRK